MSAVVPVLALRPLMFSTVLALAVSIVFGLAPALRGSKADLITALRSRTGSSAPRSRLRDSLVAAQMALSTILLVGAGLLIHSLERAANTEPGFDPAHALIARVDLSRQGYSPETGARFYEDLLREVKAIPGVSGSALSRHVPVNRSGMRVTISVPGYERKPDERMNVDYTMVSPGFFKAIGAPAIKGRDFDERDGLGAPKVAIINEALARKYFAGRDPIGQPLTDVGVTSEATIIVGIAPDMKLRTLREEPRPALYVALSQNYMSSLALVIRSEGDSSLTMAQVYEVVGRLDKELPLFGVSTLEKQLGAAVDQEKSMAVLLSGFGLLAVILASSGLGALVFQQAQSRQREFGVRLALGAGPRDVLSIVLSHGAKLALAGSLAGLAASLFLAPIIEGFLFQVGPRDPLTLAGVAATLVIVTLVASALPALRASRTNPAMALRGE
jgi:predicted permease